jgi:rhodanese-related sulfurtransferase
MSILKILQILALSAALAGYSAWVQSSRVPTVPFTEADKIPLLRLDEAFALWQEPSTIFLDVRSPEDYAYGHIQGALNLPEDEFEDRFPALQSRLSKARAIVVYCKNEDCGKSYWAALRLRKHGLTQVRIYPNGWYEWTDHGKPASAPPPR